MCAGHTWMCMCVCIQLACRNVYMCIDLLPFNLSHIYYNYSLLNILILIYYNYESLILIVEYSLKYYYWIEYILKWCALFVHKRHTSILNVVAHGAATNDESMWVMQPVHVCIPAGSSENSASWMAMAGEGMHVKQAEVHVPRVPLLHRIFSQALLHMCGMRIKQAEWAVVKNVLWPCVQQNNCTLNTDYTSIK